MASVIDRKKYYQASTEEVLKSLGTSTDGLSKPEVINRQQQYGLNIIRKRNINALHVFFRQFSSNPLIIILAIATAVSLVLGQGTSSFYIFGMIVVSLALGFWNEYAAEKTVESLLKKIAPITVVERAEEKQEIPVSEVTIGDVVILTPGAVLPADLRIIESNSLEVDQSVLSGESKTSFKNADIFTTEPSMITNIANMAFMGTAVENGSGKGVVVGIGGSTEFGKIAENVIFTKPETSFQLGLASFGRLIMKVVVILAIAIFGINAILGHSLIDSLLFSLAIAVGLTPELLPIIVTVSLSHGAGRLAKKHVVAKQLIAIENLGNMDVLCTDKTGTLTEGKITVVDYVNQQGQTDITVFNDALLCNSAQLHHKVIGNGIDSALWVHALKTKNQIPKDVKKLDEESFDYIRRFMFSVVSEKDTVRLIAKGAPDAIIPLCTNISNVQDFESKLAALGNDGYRVIVLAEKPVESKQKYSWDDARNLNLIGYITFLDTPKASTKEALHKLYLMNVLVKVITGDNEIVTKKICKEVGMEITQIVLGTEIDKMSDADLMTVTSKANVFARVNPEQKLRVLESLKKAGHTVGYMGDGINDLPCLHSADVGISVNSAVDVAKDASSIVLLKKGLDVIADGIIEGRKTFNNTIKYILMGTSSNFGNMFSAAGASFFLPFLPMNPTQILLTNSLYDVSQLSIPSDSVDHESLLKPRHWDTKFIRNYMIFFGPISSLYDFLTFGTMLFVFHAKSSLFQTGWFIESLATEVLVVFVIRTSKTPFFTSRPGKWLVITCLTVVGLGILIPFTPFGHSIGFTSPPPLYFLILIVLVVTYILLVEVLKNVFLKKYKL